jgi:hypothetical protein
VDQKYSIQTDLICRICSPVSENNSGLIVNAERQLLKGAARSTATIQTDIG